MSLPEWMADKPHPNLPSAEGDYYRTPTLTVGELREALAKFPDDAPVGICLSAFSGHIQGVKQVMRDELGCVVLDQTETTLYTEEVDFGC